MYTSSIFKKKKKKYYETFLKKVGNMGFGKMDSAIWYSAIWY